MPAATPAALRSAVFRLAGDACPAEVARRLCLPDSTVRGLLRRRAAGGDPLLPDYHRCGRHQRLDLPWHRLAVRLRQDRPRWGAGRIRVEIRRLLPDQAPPGERAIQRLFARLAAPPAPAGRPVAQESARSRLPHHTWQMDAVEQQPLQSGQNISWLRLADEASGAVLMTVVFPPGGTSTRCPPARC